MTINCNQQLISLDTPKVMGILNLTPDSFYDGGKYKNQREILEQTEKMLSDGATFIDVGAYSSRPGADHIPEEEELSRILPIVELLMKTFPEMLISIDTFRSRVAQKTIKAGAVMINDISAGNLDQAMIPAVANLQVPYIMMHMRGTPKTMKNKNQYDDMLREIVLYFSEKIAQARQSGIHDLIIDPGFGFSKNIPQNFKLLNNLEVFCNTGLPLLAGVSRKSFIYKTLGTNPKNALNGTTALHAIALRNGASILRVHDVKEAVECVKLMQALKEESLEQNS